MSILITGMDLPTVGSIEIQVFAEGKAIQSGYTVRVNGTDYYQPILGEKPAVAAIGLQAEHGRLIDADALNDMINRSYPMTDRIDVHNGYAICQEMIKQLPTIIEAEG